VGGPLCVESRPRLITFSTDPQGVKRESEVPNRRLVVHSVVVDSPQRGSKIAAGIVLN
jgi:hypothetical protein